MLVVVCGNIILVLASSYDFFYDNGDQFSESRDWNAREHPTISLNDPSNQIPPVRLSLKTLSSQMFISNFKYLMRSK